MKDTILLYHPRTFHERNYKYFHVPYSILSAASMLPREDIKVLVVDNNIQQADDWDVLDEVGRRLLCVGISSMIGHQISDGICFAQEVRRRSPSIPIIWGGALPTVLGELVLAHDHADIIVQGQGQRVLPELVAALREGRELDDLAGVGFKRQSTLVINRARDFGEFRESPPFCKTFDLIDPGAYIRSDEHISNRMISYHSSQGCPFGCGFCSEVALWKRKWTAFPAEVVLEDLEFLVRKYGVDGLKFYDAEFFIDKARVLAIAKGLLKRNFSVRWGAAIHPGNLARLSDEELHLLAASGLARLLIGAESGVQEELALVGKRTSRGMLRRIAERCAEYSVTASFTFVTGYPNMPEENIPATLEFARELRSIDHLHEVKVHFFSPYPGTPLYQPSVKAGFRPPKSLEEWATYDYYEVTTPWVDEKWESVVREFNERFCPYVESSKNGRREVCPLY